jgi:methionyl-tRNA formyltransferase
MRPAYVVSPMFDTIILLTGPVEEGALSAALLRHNPHLALRSAKTLDDLNAIDPRRLRRARLLSFASPVIVPGHILNRLGYGAYNFHPGPPNYPGWAPAHFAIYDRTTTFGVTAHVMHERVDSGPIIAVDLFDIPTALSAAWLEAIAYARMARQYFSLAKPLATSPHAPPALPVQWCGRKNTRRHCRELCNIPADISREELERRLAAFGDGRLDMVPTLTLHSHDFRYVGTKTVPVVAATKATSSKRIAAVSA